MSDCGHSIDTGPEAVSVNISTQYNSNKLLIAQCILYKNPDICPHISRKYSACTKYTKICLNIHTTMTYVNIKDWQVHLNWRMLCFDNNNNLYLNSIILLAEANLTRSRQVIPRTCPQLGDGCIPVNRQSINFKRLTRSSKAQSDPVRGVSHTWTQHAQVLLTE
jgi:hypothetical protein